MGHVLMENCNGLAVDAVTTRVSGHAERLAALEMLDDMIDPDASRRITLGADKGYDTRDFAELRERGATPHVARNQSGRRSAIDGRTTRHPGYAVSLRIRKRIEEVFGWVKSSAGQGKTLLRSATRPLRLHPHGRRLQSRPIAEAAGDRVMADIDRLVGKWRIVETGAWPREHLDLCGPAFLHVDHKGQGEMAFGALDASLNCGFAPDGIDFEWNGADEGDQVSGDGWADLRDDGCLEGGIAYRNSDETTFIAEPWERFSATC